MKTFPLELVDVLRRDITHLDLSNNLITNFEFLSGFRCLKSLIVDRNIRMDIETLPQIDTLELFYANGAYITDRHFRKRFLLHIAVKFPALRYLSIMSNKDIYLPTHEHIWAPLEHKTRMLAILLMPTLIHFNDKKVRKEELRQASDYHKHIKPVKCRLSKFEAAPDIDGLRQILPVRIPPKPFDIIAMEAQNELDDLEDALSTVTISYFVNHHDNGIFMKRSSSYDKTDSSCSDGSLTTGEGIASAAPSGHNF